VLLSACTGNSYEIKEGYKHIQKPNRNKGDWQITWQEDFNGPALDTLRWTRIPPNNADWGNYMTSSDLCYSFDDGKLHLKGIVNPDTISDPRPFLTGGIYTREKFAFQYGRIEINARLDCARGAWPAIWMLPAQEKYGEYPRNGEIDIMEHLNHDSIIYQTTHSYYTLVLKERDNPPYYGTTSFNSSDFNTFGLEWYPDRLTWTLNGIETFSYPRIEGVDPSQWPFDQPFYILIDQQLGGSWVGEVLPDDLPVSMVVDWVKIWQ
jgi:beta-glucanase (GH16 family)